MPLASSDSDSTVNLSLEGRRGQVGAKACKNGLIDWLISDITEENILLYIQNRTEMEWIIGILGILGQKIILTFHHPFWQDPSRRFLENVSDLCWVRVNNLIVWYCLLGIRTPLPAFPGVISLCPRAAFHPCEIIPAGRTGPADLIFMWTSHSCGESLSIICLHLYKARAR